MSFVKNRDSYTWQQLSHPRFAYRHVCKKQVVINDHNVCRHGLTACMVDMAGAKPRARRTQAVLARRGHPWNNGRSFVQPWQFGKIACSCDRCPRFNLGERMQCTALRKMGIVTRHFHAVQAKIAAPPFQQGGTHGDTQGFHQCRKIPAKQLVLQRLGGRRQQHTLTTEQRGYQIRKCFSNARACLHHQRVGAINRARNGQRHLGLPLARNKMFGRTRQHTVGRKNRQDLGLQIHQAGSGGSSDSSSW